MSIAGLTLFPGTPLLGEVQRGEFDPLSEKEMLEELKMFIERLDRACRIVSHRTVAIDMASDDFRADKERLIAIIDDTIENGDMDQLALARGAMKGLLL